MDKLKMETPNLVDKNIDEIDLVNKISDLIEYNQKEIFVKVNSSLILLFWHIGKEINEFLLNNKRGEYGKKIVVTVSRQLVFNYGKNFEEKNLRRMLQFAEQFKEFENVVTMSRQLSWSHILAIIPIKTEQAKCFYIQKIISENLNVRELRKSISRKAFERTEIANMQIDNKNNDVNNIFKDPYVFDFLPLNQGFLEPYLENAIIKDLENFILELGNGFAFIQRQKRMIIDGKDFHLDLLFYHRKLNRLVAVELKIGSFEAKYKGQMELYLNWLNRYERGEKENSPIGLILCTETSPEQIELLEMHKNNIVVAEYWTELPPKKLLEEKLITSYLEAKEYFSTSNSPKSPTQKYRLTEKGKELLKTKNNKTK